MKFLYNKKKEDLAKYIGQLKTISAVSRLFSESNTPYIPYRVAENMFCSCFNGINLSRSDIAYDAQIGDACFGIKTFVQNSPWQKIAEFNRQSGDIRKINKPEALVEKLANLRNERIKFADRLCKNQSSYYHCITRSEKTINIYEEEYSQININYISHIGSTRAGIEFQDANNLYRYNISKSTLYKKFIYDDLNIYSIDVSILDNPMDLLVKLLAPHLEKIIEKETAEEDYVILPLYGTKGGGESKLVPEKSALNQWNAGGREREYGEIYISIPAEIHKIRPEFFPARDKAWTLITPNKQELSAKVCQDNSKALMTNPNSAMSDWLLRDTLDIKEGEIATYGDLEKVGVDSVRITKFQEGKYSIDFAKLDSYEDFISGTDTSNS